MKLDELELKQAATIFLVIGLLIGTGSGFMISESLDEDEGTKVVFGTDPVNDSNVNLSEGNSLKVEEGDEYNETE